MGIDIHEVIDAAATKPFGFVPYYLGPGIGGHCIPIDPFYLTWKAREYGMHTRFIELAGEINSSMPEWVINRTIDALNQIEKPLKNAKILVLGIAYKCNVDDMRESPSLHIMAFLREKGADVAYSDPYVPQFPKMREHHFELSSVQITPENLATFDAVILATKHQLFDYEMIAKYANLIIDTRGGFRAYQEQTNIVSA
jgi:UDP-N-acetyl-D-glucosamine dehydrogenase